MSLLNNKKAEEIIELCLSEESHEHKSRVLEILAASEIEPNDPLFLVLMASGSLRFLTEESLAELKAINSEIRSQRAEHIKVMKALIEGLAKTTSELNQASSRIEAAIQYKKKSFSFNKIWKLFFGVLIICGLSITSYSLVFKSEEVKEASFIYLTLYS